MTIFRDIILGAGSLPHYGPHPGTPILIFMTVIGAGVILALFGPLWIAGCIGRARGDRQFRS